MKALEVIKEDERGLVYGCDKLKFFTWKKGSVGADHTHPEPEIIYLLKGEFEVMIGDKVNRITAPKRFEVSGGLYHKYVALSDVEFLEDR